MTTLELIEKHGIGHNCLSDAYELGRKDAIEEILSWMDNNCWVEKELLEYLEQLKEQKNDK